MHACYDSFTNFNEYSCIALNPPKEFILLVVTYNMVLNPRSMEITEMIKYVAYNVYQRYFSLYGTYIYTTLHNSHFSVLTN
jgi:hypothetical protein